MGNYSYDKKRFLQIQRQSLELIIPLALCVAPNPNMLSQVQICKCSNPEKVQDSQGSFTTDVWYIFGSFDRLSTKSTKPPSFGGSGAGAGCGAGDPRPVNFKRGRGRHGAPWRLYPALCLIESHFKLGL